MDKNKIKLFCISLVLFVPFLGISHLFDWDEINFAESAREMIVSGNYTTVQINFQPFWEKPPFFFWLQVLCMKVFGINEFAARLPNALVGVVTLQVLYGMGKRWHNASFGWLWALGYLGSFTPFLYFKTGIIDPLFNLFIFVSLSFTASFFQEYAIRKTLLAGVFIGLAVLTKGPVALLIWGLVTGIFVLFGITNPKQHDSVQIPNSDRVISGSQTQNGVAHNPATAYLKAVLVFFLSFLLTASVWFGIEFYQHGSWFFEQFIQYQIRLFSTPDAGHEQPFYYHFVVVLLGCFPISVLAIRYLFRRNFSEKSPFYVIQFILFWVVMILFSIVRTKIVHYSSLAWFPVSYFAAYFWSEQSQNWSKAMLWGFRVVGILLSLVLMAIPLIGMNTQVISPYIKDVFAVANLKAQVHWQGWEWLLGLVYLVAIWVWYRLPERMFLATATCIALYLAVVVPKVEGYTQGAAIRFYESLKGKNVDVEAIGFKSYAQLFYFQKPPQEAISADDLLNAPNLKRPAYFVTKIDRAEEYLKNPRLKLIREENGFLFFYREK